MARKMQLPEAERPGTSDELRQIGDIAAGGREIEVKLRGQPLTLWWQDPGFAETEQQRAAALGAAIEAERNGFLMAILVASEAPEGGVDGKNLRFTLAQEYVKPRSVRILLNGAPKEPRRDFNLADNTVFFARQCTPQPGDKLDASYEYYDPDLYDAYTRAARVLVMLWAGLRELTDHDRRWFDGYDEVKGQRVHRGGYSGLKTLDAEELAALMTVAFEEITTEAEVPNLPAPSNGGADSDTPSATA